MRVNWADVRQKEPLEVSISDSGNSGSEDPYACSRAAGGEPLDGLQLGCFSGEGSGLPPQGSWLLRSAAGKGSLSATWCWHLEDCSGVLRVTCGPCHKPTSPHLNCTGSVFMQSILPTHQFSPACSPIEMVLDRHETIVPIFCPIFLTRCHPPTSLQLHRSGCGLPYRFSDAIDLAYNQSLALNPAVPHLASISLLPKNALSYYRN